MENNPAISVLFPVYNAQQYLRQAIESVLNQTFTNFELLIVNDGSTDHSKDIILSYSDPRIHYVENEVNLGLIKTLNKGIALCRGQYIARMDADDICEPERLKAQWRFMQQHPAVGLCSTWASVIDENGTITGKIVNQTKPTFISIALLFSAPLIHPAVCIKASLLKQNNYEEVAIAEDYDLWCRLNDQTQLANIPNFLLQYRWHNANISKEKGTIQKANKELVTKRELSKLGLSPDEETLRIHLLSFSLYSLGQQTNSAITTADLSASEKWFTQLLAANKQKKRYNSHAFVAFLWARWVVLCLTAKQKKKILFPSFASYHPKVVFYLFQQLCLLAKK